MLEGVPTTIRDLVRATRVLIADAGVGDTAGLDAELLVGHVTNLHRVALRTRSEDGPTREQLARLDELVGRRLAGEPVAYLIGTAWFYGREFRVDRRVLVPRPETEALVEVALEHLATHDRPAVVIDVCTGSGCVAISVAAEAADRWPRRDVRVIGTDISADALHVALTNAQRLAPTVELVEADLLAGVAAPTSVNLITANPPYVEGADAVGLEAAVRDHEPAVALYAPGSGVAEIYSRLAIASMELLEPGGLLAVEHGQGQRDLVTKVFTEAGLMIAAVHDDLAGVDRIVVGQRPANEGAS